MVLSLVTRSWTSSCISLWIYMLSQISFEWFRLTWHILSTYNCWDATAKNPKFIANKKKTNDGKLAANWMQSYGMERAQLDYSYFTQLSQIIPKGVFWFHFPMPQCFHGLFFQFKQFIVRNFFLFAMARNKECTLHCTLFPSMNIFCGYFLWNVCVSKSNQNNQTNSSKIDLNPLWTRK